MAEQQLANSPATLTKCTFQTKYLGPKLDFFHPELPTFAIHMDSMSMIIAVLGVFLFTWQLPDGASWDFLIKDSEVSFHHGFPHIARFICSCETSWSRAYFEWSLICNLCHLTADLSTTVTYILLKGRKYFEMVCKIYLIYITVHVFSEQQVELDLTEKFYGSFWCLVYSLSILFAKIIKSVLYVTNKNNKHFHGWAN